jgi:DNA-binding NtrC family response regulator
MNEHNILVVEKDQDSRRMLVDSLENDVFNVSCVMDGEEALSIISSKNIDVLITELEIPKMDGMSLLTNALEANQDIIVFMTAKNASVDIAVNAMKIGVEEFLTKPVMPEKLIEKIKLSIKKKKQKNLKADQTTTFRKIRENIIGNSKEIKDVFELVGKISDTDSTVLIYGESGTGKELIAKAIHYSSYRKDRPFIPVNCGAIPDELLESELFGHEKGSFTGAHKARTGRFELADTGTVFLDEIGDMSPNLQVKILRVLQEQELERVGGVRPVKVDIRIIAATHRDLEKAVADSKFREDLYYRLNVIPITLPSLRDRNSDVSLLVNYFINIFNIQKSRNIQGVTKEALECLKAYRWPGNIRELQNIIERIVVLKMEGVIDVEDLPDKILSGRLDKDSTEVKLPENGASFNSMVTNFEKQLIQQALTKSSGVKNKAAKLLNMNRTTLVEKIKKLKLEN